MSPSVFLHRAVFAVGLSAVTLWVQAEEINAAVASNFTAPLQEIVTAFEKESGHKVQVVSGATGKFYAQIKNGAPFDVLLSADSTTPLKLESEDAAVKGSRFTYATGKLVLWSATPGFVDDQGAVLKGNAFKHLAIANPETAPYGAAAVQTLKALGVLETLQPKFVQGENITHTHQFVATGNAELGFVALSQVMVPDKSGTVTISNGSAWLVDPSRYKPLHQDAVLLKRAKDSAGAKALLEYLKGETARVIMAAYGYETGTGKDEP